MQKPQTILDPAAQKEDTREKTAIIDDDEIIRLYMAGASLRDVGIAAGISHARVYRLLKGKGVKVRKIKQGRKLALQNGRIRGKTYRHVNERFFLTQSSDMAYVLGMVATDGNVYIKRNESGRVKDARLSLSLIDEEHILMIQEIMGSDLYIHRSQRNERAQYCLQAYSLKLVNSLISWGIGPNKSLTLKYPSIDPRYDADFIRGCWDGDGSFYIEKRSGNLKASFVSGSRDFIDAIVSRISANGVDVNNVYSDKRTKNESFYFRITKESGIRALYSYLYPRGSGTHPMMERKHSIIAGYLNGLDSAKRPQA